MNILSSLWPYSPLIIPALFIVLAWLFCRDREGHEHRDNSPGLDNSMDWHRRNGSWRVMYTDTIMPNGKYGVSQPFSREVANDYTKMFGGVVIDRDAEVPLATEAVRLAHRD